MATTLSYDHPERFFKDLSKVPFLGSPDSATPVGMKGVVLDGQLHLSSHLLGDPRSRGGVRRMDAGTPAREVVWSDLTSPGACGHCLKQLESYPHIGPRLLGLAITFMTRSEQLKNARKVNERTSAVTLERRAESIRRWMSEIGDIDHGALSSPLTWTHMSNVKPVSSDPSHAALAKDGLTGDALERVDAAFRELEHELGEALRAMTRASASDEAKERVAAQVRRAMLPSRLRDSDVMLDTSPVVVGVPDGRARSDLAKAAINAYGVGTGRHRVLLAPAFVYAFLVRDLMPNMASNEFVASAPAAGVSEAVLETAAGIWDPHGDGDLVCLSTTIALAHELA